VRDRVPFRRKACESDGIVIFAVGKFKNGGTAMTKKPEGVICFMSKKSTEGKATKSTEKKRTNKTIEAFKKSKGCFIVNDPNLFL